ncbi:MAG: hypothetical protein KBD29_04130, partial [Candidatus Magasanikbacteria bacterium]|nr:hypothetical protein [Candidatus Magasanikbacteria bacterium]
MKIIIPLLMFVLTVLFVPSFAHATEIRPYPISEGQEFVGTPNLPTILWHTTIPVPWKSGKVVIAGNPDGTGSIDVGVQFEVYASDISKSFKFYAGCDEKPMPPMDITYLMGPRYPHLGGDSNILIRFSKVFCNNAIKIDGVYKSYYNVGPAYLVHFDDAPEQIQPFLDLPWDYKADGNLFETVVTEMSSYFDHAYPLLSTGLSEPSSSGENIITYRGVPQEVEYTSHDGYDWARTAGAVLSDPVLAAAGGVATYKYYGACGNMIMID